MASWSNVPPVEARFLDHRSSEKKEVTAVRVLARTAKGPRDLQQDAYAWVGVGRSEGGGRLCCVLADGMGGVAGGGLASRLAVSAALQSLYPSLLTASEEQWEDPRFHRSALRTAFTYASAVLATAARGAPALEEMATTLAVTVHIGSGVLVGHSGDTRVYAYGEQLQLLTRDHSAAWPLVESDLVAVSELRHVGTRSALTRFVSAGSAGLEVTVHRATKGTSFLLATDGFWGLFDTAELGALMEPLGEHAPSAPGSPEDVAEHLFEEAMRRKPEDNVTFILVAPDGPRRGRRTERYPGVGGSSVFVRTEKEEESHGAKGVPVRRTR